MGEEGGRPRVADFVHGSDGLGNISLPPPKSKKIEKAASEFLVDMVSKYPGNEKGLILCKQGQESSYSWWIFLCIGECQSCC
ncbi:unnamed protein product [Camellia sinensis]